MARREARPSGPGSRALIVDLIRSSGPISRVELTTATGLTQPTISNIVRRLIDDGVVRETGSTVATKGKPRTLLEINSRATFGIGIQLGAESIVYVATDTSGGLFGRERVHGAGSDAPEVVVERLVDEYTSFLGALGIDPSMIAGVAVVAPGPIDQANGTILGPPSLRQWSDFGLLEALRARIGAPILVDNDGAAAAIGEFWSRKISRTSTFACIYMGTGIGGGIVLGGSLHRGASSNAGELGHTSIDPAGRECFCGGVGCLERYASPPAIVDDALADAELTSDLRLARSHGIERNFDEIARAAVQGHPAALALVEGSARQLSQAALALVNLVDLDTVVLAGPAFAIAGSIYARTLREVFETRAFARVAHTIEVVLSKNPRDSAPVGAAALMLQSSVAPGHGPSGSPVPEEG